MNIKEAFRYQSFLMRMMGAAASSITKTDHALKTTRYHRKSETNPDAEDFEETVEVEEFFPNDTVIQFMLKLVEEREKLSSAIIKAKTEAPFELDMVLEGNKMRQMVVESVRRMISISPYKRSTQNTDYKFNAEGNQMPYLYNIDVVAEAAYDRDSAKRTLRELTSKSDMISTMIDTAMINATVDYEPLFDVNDEFDDVVAKFCESLGNI